MTTPLRHRGRPSIDGLPLHPLLRLRRLVGAACVAGLHGLVFAQAGPVAVDESKVPDWVRRQASSPMKIIISSDQARRPAAAAPAKAEPPARARPLRTAAEAGQPAAPAASAATAVAAAQTTAAQPASAQTTPAQPAQSAPPAATAAAAVATLEPVALTPVKAAATAPDTPAEQLALVAPTSAATAATTVPEVVVESELRLLRRVDPQLPRLVLEGLGSAANVEIAFTVNPDGSVSNANVVSSSHAPLNRPTLAAVKAWRFEPIASAREQRVSFSFGGR